jgi:hypothetical protein
MAAQQKHAGYAQTEPAGLIANLQDASNVDRKHYYQLIFFSLLREN